MTFVLAFALLFALLWVVVLAIGPVTERLMRRAAHYTAQFRYRDYVPVVVLLAAGVGGAVLAGNAFVELAESVQSSSTELQMVDTSVHSWTRSTRTQGATMFFTTMTLIGTPAGLGLFALAVVIWLATQGRWRWAAYLAITGGIGGLLNLQLKAWFARARPELAEALREAHGYSFPSGHAMGSTIVFGALSYLAFRMIHRWRWRAVALAFGGTMVLAISASRIYLGVHWISDVIAGISAGTIWVVVTTVAYETFRRIRMVRALRAKARDANAGG